MVFSSFTHLITKQGYVGSLRFCLRMDLDPSSFGKCSIEEIRGSKPHGSDLIVLAKRYMADIEPFRVICLLPAAVCLQLRMAFQQPEGVCARRAISEKVVNNIKSIAPQCAKQNIISRDALAYLMSWVNGDLVQVPRPASYKFLTLRRYPIDLPAGGPVAWVKPARARVVTIYDGDGGSASEDDGATGPVEFEDDA